MEIINIDFADVKHNQNMCAVHAKYGNFGTFYPLCHITGSHTHSEIMSLHEVIDQSWVIKRDIVEWHDGF